MARLGCQIIASFALWFGIIFTGCYKSRDTSKSSEQTEQERNPETNAESKEPPVGNQGVSDTWESLHIEMQPDSEVLCPGECTDIAVRVLGGNPPYHFSWDRELSSVTTRGPHRVCPDADTTYTVSVRDTGLDSQEFAIPSEHVQGSTTISVVDDCTSSILVDASFEASVEDESEPNDADASDVDDASDDSTNDTGVSTTNDTCEPNCPDLEWVTIEGGSFIMGSAEGIGIDNEHPQHEVTVPSFKMSKTEVTVAQYGSCVDAGICSEPYDSEWGNWGKSGRENHPINEVTWYQAREFAQWLDGRLPSEAEWEYAARSGGRDDVYPWGDEDATCERAVIYSDASFSDCGNNTTSEVCSKPLGNTVQGLCDMAGNVREWLEDEWHDSYYGAPSDGQAWISDSLVSISRVLRGGSLEGDSYDCRSAARDVGGPLTPYHEIGFRVVLDPK